MFAALFQWPREHWCVAHRRIGYAHHHGLAQGVGWIIALLYVWQHVSRESGCVLGAAGGRNLRPTVPGRYGGRDMPGAFSALRRANALPDRLMRGCEPRR